MNEIKTDYIQNDIIRDTGGESGFCGIFDSKFPGGIPETWDKQNVEEALQ